MSITGHYRDGVIVPASDLPLPEGALVEIVVPASPRSPGDEMSPEELTRYNAALAALDDLPQEEGGEEASGADHDRLLYGEGYGA